MSTRAALSPSRTPTDPPGGPGDPDLIRITERYDLIRSVPVGLLIAVQTSVLLTVLITRFDASNLTKGILTAGTGVGMLAAPFVTSLSRWSGRPAMSVAALVSVFGGTGFLLAGAGSAGTLVIGGVIGTAAMSAVVPLMTATYQSNFPARERGRRVGRTMAVRVGVAALAGLALGALLRTAPGLWWLIPISAAVASITAAAFGRRIPSRPVPPLSGGRNGPWPHFGLLRSDPVLRTTMASWMLAGFANLMLLPLRVEYLAEPRYGIAADAATITLITVTVPSVARLLTLPWFGRLFDRLPFFPARIGLNLLLALYVVVFFLGSGMPALLVGAVLVGAADAAGDIMWNLWVTKFATADRVADYMGLHTFATGVRGVLAPLVAFTVIERYSLGTVAGGGAALIVLSSLLLLARARAEHHDGPISAC